MEVWLNSWKCINCTYLYMYMCASRMSGFLVNKMNVCNIDQQVIADKVEQ